MGPNAVPEERLSVPTFVSGLPLHPLIVHAVVVLLPMAVLGAVLIAVWPAIRARWAWPVVVLTVAAVVAIPLATSTGEGLEHNLPRTPALAAHAELGDQLLVFAAPLLVCVFALAFLDGRRRRGVPASTSGPGTMAAPVATSGRARVTAVLLAVLTVAFAVVCGVQVFRIGDSGARAAWGDVRYTPQTHAFRRP
jgi:predicted membrane protein DUF2231